MRWSILKVSHEYRILLRITLEILVLILKV